MAGRFLLLGIALLPFGAGAEVICALGPAGSSYNAYEDQRPSPDAMELAGQVNAALTPICRPKCPMIALFRNATAANAMLIADQSEAKIVYAPQFFTALYDSAGDGAVIAVIAHELGHAVDETSPAPWVNRNWPPEVRADAWAGCVLGKMNLSARALQETLAAVSKYPSAAHPSWGQRLPALRLGYAQCGGDGTRFDSAAAMRKRND